MTPAALVAQGFSPVILRLAKLFRMFGIIEVTTVALRLVLTLLRKGQKVRSATHQFQSFSATWLSFTPQCS